MSYTHILVPLDGSQLAEFILPHEQNLTTSFGSEVSLFHVIESRDVDPEN